MTDGAPARRTGSSARSAVGVWTVSILAACGGSPALEEPPPRPVLDPVTVSERPRTVAAPVCEPTEGALTAGEALPEGSTAYRLVMVRGDAATRPAWVEGRLALEPRPADLRQVREWSAPLQGTADIDVARVGAWDTGALDSHDPQAPGVLVLQTGGAEPTLLLRFGSTANRTDRTPFDQAFTVLTVRDIVGDSFSGSWRSGAFGDEVRGHFCATAVTP